ncbi:hypothetical protein NEOLI_002599 [Neolecta irregularis DAH-3]|uniref:Zn(2)-C6 fungal-type domain-containing protein n=1 Tax=Neolecta irregularis (strain DAH-3) TaxID=1198029 RepID=A0A1U7LVG1_NEOID|nr:hypothetical protein NEOLI_002599 [Neolecta irregularis DAH-3]|eukprot:OLL26666.1 hypothetical protein NEOLI_002599 [Neolecta irregularis DAH-3]
MPGDLGKALAGSASRIITCRAFLPSRSSRNSPRRLMRRSPAAATGRPSSGSPDRKAIRKLPACDRCRRRKIKCRRHARRVSDIRRCTFEEHWPICKHCKNARLACSMAPSPSQKPARLDSRHQSDSVTTYISKIEKLLESVVSPAPGHQPFTQSPKHSNLPLQSLPVINEALDLRACLSGVGQAQTGAKDIMLSEPHLKTHCEVKADEQPPSVYVSLVNQLCEQIPADLAESLTLQYFSSLHPLFPIIDQDSFSTNSHSGILSLTVAFAASRISTDSRCRQNAELDKAGLLTRVNLILNDYSYITTAHLIAMVVVRLCSSRDRLSHGLTVRLWNSTFDRDLRTGWYIWIADTWESALLGLLPTMPLPPEGTFSQSLFFSSFSSATEVLHRVMISLYPIKESGDAACFQNINALRSDLANWFANVPSKKQLGPSWGHTFSGILNIVYLSINILLHRPLAVNSVIMTRCASGIVETASKVSMALCDGPMGLVMEVGISLAITILAKNCLQDPDAMVDVKRIVEMKIFQHRVEKILSAFDLELYRVD